ncbi:PilZ domain-containing protein [Thermodesulfobacteriota bacterium]
MKELITKILKLNKRKYHRFLIDDLDFIIFDKDSPEEKYIVDLSSEGISFVYTCVDNIQSLDQVIEIDIKYGDTFHLGKVRVKQISDSVISDNPNKNEIIRRFGGRFINITIPQQYELNKFLKEFGKKI